MFLVCFLVGRTMTVSVFVVDFFFKEYCIFVNFLSVFWFLRRMLYISSPSGGGVGQSKSITFLLNTLVYTGLARMQLICFIAALPY